MAIKIEHISSMEFRISGVRTFEGNGPNRAVLVVVYIYDPITELYMTTRGLTEVAKSTTGAYGEYVFQRKWLPGDYVIKFYGTGKGADIQIDTDWEYFSIAQKGIYDITPPSKTEIFKINY